MEFVLVQLLKLVIAALLTLAIIGGVAWAGHHIEWWLAALISLVLVFGGALIIIHGDDLIT